MGGRGGVLLGSQERGGSPGGEGPSGREGVCVKLGIMGRGLNIFFSGPKCPPSFVLEPEVRIQYTYTYVKILSTIDFELDTRPLRFPQEFTLLQIRIHILEICFWSMNSNSIRIHIRQKIARNSKCSYSRAHGKQTQERNPCGSACCGLVCGSPRGSPMWGGQFSPWPAINVTEPWRFCRETVLFLVLSALSKTRSGRTDPVQLKRAFLNRALFAYKNGRFASSFLLIGIDFYKPQTRQICLSKVPLRNPI